METSVGDDAREKKKSLQDYMDAARRDELDKAGPLLSDRKMMGLSREAAREAIGRGPPSGEDVLERRLGQRLDRHKEKLKELSRQATGKQMAGLEETPEERADDI